MKTTEEFNNKYKDYLEKGFYGLNINNEEFINWLDNKFQEFINRPGFKYFQIKAKFGTGIIYAKGLTNEEEIEIEDKITEICKIK